MKVIVIDPGHGGWDPGSRATDGRQEKEFTLALGHALRQMLRRYRCRVLLTRETDRGLAPPDQLDAELRDRAAVANREKAALFLSLHHDSSGLPSTRGGSLYVWTNKRAPDGGLVWLPAVDGKRVNHAAPYSYALAREMYPLLRETLAGLDIPSRAGIMCADFGVLRASDVPAMLLECFYGSSPDDVATVRREGFIAALAKGIARAVAAALELEPAWDPAREIEELLRMGLIDTRHRPDDRVTWGELATVVNRLLSRLEP